MARFDWEKANKYKNGVEIDESLRGKGLVKKSSNVSRYIRKKTKAKKKAEKQVKPNPLIVSEIPESHVEKREERLGLVRSQKKAKKRKKG